MRMIDDLISRLETRRMSLPGLQCLWCPSCLRVSVTDPKIKGSFDLLYAGEEDCRQPIRSGPISECLTDLRREGAERELEYSRLKAKRTKGASARE